MVWLEVASRIIFIRIFLSLLVVYSSRFILFYSIFLFRCYIGFICYLLPVGRARSIRTIIATCVVGTTIQCAATTILATHFGRQYHLVGIGSFAISHSSSAVATVASQQQLYRLLKR